MAKTIDNKTFDALQIGDSVSVRRKVAPSDIRAFVTIAADVLHDAIDRELAADPDFRAALSAGGTAATLATALVAARLPGSGTRLTGMQFDIEGALRQEDVALVRVQVVERDADDASVALNVTCEREDGTRVLSGRLEAIAPAKPVSRPFGLPVALDGDTAPDRLNQIEDLARDAAPVRMAVVNPVDEASLTGALDSAAAGLITPVLIAPAAALHEAAEASGVDLSEIETIDCADGHAAAERAAALAADGDCGAIMKGKIHTGELLKAILNQPRLRTGRRMSHAFIEDLPGYPRLLFVADAAVNITPDLTTLRDIVQNTVDLARAIGIDRPKVALLSAVETVTDDIPSTIAAAAISKMADRGEITGADVDGPLAMDNAVSEQAARIKGISSKVAGQADILIAPDLEAANILAKDLDYLAGAEAAGIALGARVPIALTSRADTPRERRASAAIAAILAARNPSRNREEK